MSGARGLLVLRVAAPLGAIVMFATIAWALATGAALGADGSVIAALVWGRVTFIDLALALVLGWSWIAWREASLGRALIWLVLTAVTGSGAILVYLSIAAWREQDLTSVLARHRGPVVRR